MPSTEKLRKYLEQLCAISDADWERIPGALASGISRTRYIDDLLERRVVGDVRQVILPGAGFDARALAEVGDGPAV